jgi:hypothetical protein
VTVPFCSLDWDLEMGLDFKFQIRGPDLRPSGEIDGAL